MSVKLMQLAKPHPLFLPTRSLAVTVKWLTSSVSWLTLPIVWQFKTRDNLY